MAVLFTLIVGRPWSEPVPTEVRLGLKVPQVEYAVAQRLNQVAGEGQPVLAPETVSAWVPTFRRHAYPLVARRHYTEGILAVFGGRIDRADIQDRLVLHDLISGDTDSPESYALLERWLAENRITAVALTKNHREFGRLSTAIQEAGFTSSKYLGYVIFYKPG